MARLPGRVQMVVVQITKKSLLLSYWLSSVSYTHLQGQCLHAVGLRFVHPRTGEMVELSCPLPEEFQEVLRKLAAKK